MVRFPKFAARRSPHAGAPARRVQVARCYGLMVPQASGGLKAPGHDRLYGHVDEDDAGGQRREPCDDASAYCHVSTSRYVRSLDLKLLALEVPRKRRTT